MKKSRRRIPLDPTRLARREDIFRVYCNMGPTRNYDRLLAAIEAKHGSVSKRTLANWSQQHSWQARVADYDRDLTKGFQIQADDLDPNFDQRDMLLKAAHLALLRVLQSNPVARTPQDAKALIDAANNVLKSVELLRVNAPDREGSGNGTKQMFEVLAVIEARVRNTEQPQSRTIDGQAIRVTEPALLAPPEVMVGGRLIEIGMLLMRGGRVSF